MKSKQVLLFMLCIAAFSCSSESTETPEENEENTDSTLIKKIVYNSGTEDEYTETFAYEGNKLTRVETSEGDKNVYTYENDLLMREDQYFSGELAAYLIFEYNTEEKVASYTENFLEPSDLEDRKYKHNLSYNSNGTITDEIHVSYNDSDFELERTEIFSLNENNISRIESGTYTVTYTYDDKNGIFKNIHAIEILNILSENEFGALIYGNSNNIKSYQEEDSSLNHQFGKEVFEYTYNENGYPKSGVSKYEYNDGVIEENDTETIEFFYE